MPSSEWAGSPAGCEGSRAQPSLVLLVGKLGHPGWSWTVVADDGRTPLPCARQRFPFCLATCRLSLSLAVGVRVASTWVDPPRRWREGQGHDGWNREMVQRREGLRLHRPRV